MALDEQERAVQGIKYKGKRKAAYYKLQRENAEEGGDQGLTDKIYGKLGKKSHNVDSDRGNKAILGIAPFLPEAAAGLGEMGAVRLATSEGMAIRNAYHGIPKAGEEAAEAAEGAATRIPKRMEAPKAGPKKYSIPKSEAGKIKNPKLKQAMGGNKRPGKTGPLLAAGAIVDSSRTPKKKANLATPKNDKMTPFEKSHRVRTIR